MWNVIFYSVGASCTVTLIMADSESSWSSTCLPNTFKPSTRTLDFELSFLNDKWTDLGHFCGYNCNPCTSSSSVITVSFWNISSHNSCRSSLFNADLPMSLSLNFKTWVSSMTSSVKLSSLGLSGVSSQCLSIIRTLQYCPHPGPQSCGMLSPTKPHWGALAGPVIHLNSSTALWNLHHCLLKVQNKYPLVLSLILNIPVSQLLSGIPGVSDITPANFCPQILYGMVQFGEKMSWVRAQYQLSRPSLIPLSYIYT